MTSQTFDSVQLDGAGYGSWDYPLESLSETWEEILLPNAVRPVFPIRTTSCRRGYVATWLVEDGKLFLVGVAQEDNPFGKPEAADMLAVFGAERVFATWYTGQLRCPDGKYVPEKSSMYSPYYERWRVLSFENGTRTNDKLVVQESVFANDEQP